jgi:hypothetical protein
LNYVFCVAALFHQSHVEEHPEGHTTTGHSFQVCCTPSSLLYPQISLSCLPKAFQPRALSLASSTLGAVARSGKPKPCKGHICARRHVTNPPQKSAEAPLDPELHWIDLLEKVSKSSSLSSPPKQHENILKRCYFFIFHTTIYLFRPMSKDPKESQTASNNFLMVCRYFRISVCQTRSLTHNSYSLLPQ